MIRAHCFPAFRSPGCMFYRIFSPWSYLSDILKVGEFRATISPEISDANINDSQIIVFQRASSPKDLDLIKRALAKDKKIVYEVDDDLFNLPKTNPHYKHYKNPEIRDAMKQIATQAHAITVSTDPLKEIYSRYNENVCVIPNAMDFRLVKPRTHNNKKLVVGYAGAIEHASEFNLISKCLSALTKGEFLSKVLVKLFHYKFPRCETIKYFPFEQYHEALRISDFDIGLAPIALNQFNICKSNLKWVEYGAYSTSTIGSNVYPYCNTINHGVDGLIAERLDDWADYIIDLINNPDKLALMQNAAYVRVKEEFNVDKTCLLWFDLFNKLLGESK